MGVLLWTLAAEEPWDWLAPERVAVELDRQVYLVPEPQLERLARARPAWLSEAEAQALDRIEQGIDQELDALFARVHARVPTFADWYYSAPGVGVRFLAAMPYPRDTGDKLAEAVTVRLFPPDAWPRELDALERALSARYSAEFSALERRWLAWLAQELAPYRQQGPLPEGQQAIDVNQRLHAQLTESLGADPVAVQVGAGVGAGALLARGAIARANARAASGRAAARLASRGTAASGSAACAGTGPLAIGCGVAVFTTVTLVTEWGLLRADEALNRPDLEQALHASVEALHETLRDEYAREFVAAFASNLDTLRDGVQTSLRPIDRIRGVQGPGPAGDI
ncbi:hypothetical protein HUS23_08930 [Ectothiorhodospiraceae bacterium 2226]|nr:hypothetical protein HUS23_08930 [Ectothiorhodospiraceae bacterium 2226]